MVSQRVTQFRQGTITCRWAKINPHAHFYLQEVGLRSRVSTVLRLVDNIVRGVQFVVFIPFLSHFVIHMGPRHSLGEI
jgi:hypothetical protein